MLPKNTDSRLRSVLDDVRALPPRERFIAATELVGKLREQMAEAAEIRAQALWVLHEQEGSLSKVAKLVGITKSRAEGILGPLSQWPQRGNDR